MTREVELGAARRRHRPRRLRCGPVRLSALMVLVVMTLPAPHGGEAGERMTLEEANGRWRGARCRSREPIVLTGEVDRDDVAMSRWLAWLRPGVTNPNAPPAALGRFVFEGGDVLLRRFGRGLIPASTEFTALGWGENERGGGVFLEVGLPTIPARGRLFFYTPKPPPFRRKLKLKRLDECERWARFEVFEILEAPDEQLVEVESERPETPPTPVSAASPASRRPAASVGVFAPAITLHGVSVQPVQVAPGDEMLLVLTYQIEGVPPGARVEVTETRRLMSGDEEMTAFREKLDRGAGSVTSKLPVRIPASLAPGMYSVRAVVELAGLRSTGAALFEVRPDPS